MVRVTAAPFAVGDYVTPTAVHLSWYGRVTSVAGDRVTVYRDGRNVTYHASELRHHTAGTVRRSNYWHD
jgi:hypothetical protein